MAEFTYKAPNGFEFTITDDDVINSDDFISADDCYNPHGVKPWLLHDHGFVICVVFASGLQDALDIAVNEDKMDRFLVKPEDLKDYEDEEGITFLGNAGERFDIESLDYLELPNPKYSWVAMFAASQQA